MRTFRLVIFLAVMIVASDAWAEEATPTLAKFAVGANFPQNHIKFPDVNGDVSVAAYCYARILGGGDIQRNICFESSSMDQKFNDAVEAGMKDAKVTAASVNGKKYAVGLYYRVVFIRQEGKSFIGVYPNWGNDVDKYGIEYSAPQRYSTALRPAICTDVWSRFRAFATMRIGIDGAVKGDVSMELSALNIDDERCADSIEDLHKSLEYIPGEYEGDPVDATYVEGWGIFENMVVESSTQQDSVKVQKDTND